MGPWFFLPEHLLYHSHRKTRWTTWVDNARLNIYLLGTSNSMITLTFSPSQDAFNNQSNILQGLGTTSRSMVETGRKAPSLTRWNGKSRASGGAGRIR